MADALEARFPEPLGHKSQNFAPTLLPLALTDTSLTGGQRPWASWVRVGGLSVVWPSLDHRMHVFQPSLMGRVAQCLL